MGAHVYMRDYVWLDYLSWLRSMASSAALS